MMNMPKEKVILLTGVSGFLGANIAEFFLANGYVILALVRETTNLWRCKSFIDAPNFNIIYIERSDLNSIVMKMNPSVLIHCAWDGVKLDGRDDWGIQIENINLTYKLLSLAKTVGIKQVIACGSQFEYGLCDGRVDEGVMVNPNSAYASAKVSTYFMLKQFCEQNSIEWQWLRLFSMIGKYEDEQWLTSYVIKNVINKKEINLTGCKQRLDYVDVRFVVKAIEAVVSQQGNSGLYNLGSNTSIELRDLISIITDQLYHFNPIVNIGALPYRKNQVMHIEGNAEKFYKTFSFYEKPRLIEGVREIIDYYL